MECKQLAKDLAGDIWTLGELKELSIEASCNWSKSDIIGYDRDAYLGLEKYVDFENENWFELVKTTWRNHRRVFQDHIKYIRNEIVKLFRVGIIHYADHVQDMHDL